MKREKVKFKNGMWTIVGEMFFPENFKNSEKYPSIIFSHPGGGVKEQVSSVYAEGMQKAGYFCLTFDATHQGESEGEPKLLDNPYERTEDIKCAVDYLTTLHYIDRNKIGAIGQCAGAGYAIFAALTDRRIKAICGICCTNPGATTRLGWEGKRSIEKQKKILDKICEQRTIEANGGQVKYSHYVPELEEINDETPKELIEGNKYYRTSLGGHKNSPNLYIFTGLAYRMTFDAYEFIPDFLDRPFLVIAGGKAGSLWQSKKAFEMANEPKELYIIDEAAHFDFYGNEKYINMAIDKLIEFFNKYLKNINIIDFNSLDRNNNLKKYKNTKTLEGHTEKVVSLIQLSSGNLATGSNDCSVRIWDIEKGECICSFSEKGKVLCLLEFEPNKILTGTTDNNIGLWDVNNPTKSLYNFNKHELWVNGLVKCNEKTFATCSNDQNIYIWDYNNRKCIGELSGHNDCILCLIKLNDGNLCSAGADMTIKIWDWQKKSCILDLKCHDKYIKCLYQLKDGTLLSGSDDKTIKIWKNNKCIKTLEAHNHSVRALCQVDDDHFASGSFDNTIKIWDLNTFESNQTLEGHKSPVICVIKLKNNKLASCSNDKTIKIWE